MSRLSHLVPRQFAWTRPANDPATLPLMIVREDKSILYRFKPHMATSERFEKVGGGPGYIWGFGVGHLEYIVPAREDRRRVSEHNCSRAHSAGAANRRETGKHQNARHAFC